ncbi:hypothetical protein [Seonamhaeicola marinus]|uniref:Uncharacterized protein n=1 Tax=Seonamhaeicola marinus TaxID=1912246 RepID=A0A5D0IKN4_9FLAO|nr:hypothetical protein [Seonamhaeicola marinus]TYA84355.1 hypothetical protein FUA24_06840 [Seonamhaeicola marinus]
MNKNTLVCFVFLLFLNFFYAQEYIEIPVAGISKEIEKKILPYDVIPSDFGLNNISISLRNEGKKGWPYYSSKIYKVNYNPETKHYDTEGLVVKIKKESKYYTLNKPVIIQVRAGTIYGNVIWTQVRRTPSNLTDPIVLDQYSSVEGKPETKPSYKIIMTGKEINPNVLGSLQNGEEILINGGLSIKLKNRSQQKYMSEIVLNGSQKGRLFAKAPLGSLIAPSEPIEAMISFRTNFGNFIWAKYYVENNRSRRRMDAQYHYSGEEGKVDAPLSKIVKEFTPTATTEKTTVPSEETDTPPNLDKESLKTEEETPLNQNLYTLKQHKGTLELAKVPNDSIKGSFKSTLLKDATVTVANQTVQLKGGTAINFNATKKHIITAVANGDQTIATDYGNLTLKDGEQIRFSPYRVTGFHLKENTPISTKYGEVIVKANHLEKYDITLTDSGKLIDFTTAKDKDFSIGSHTIPVASNSFIKFIDDQILQINLAQNLDYDIANLNLTIAPGNVNKTSIKFKPKTSIVSTLYITQCSDIMTSDGPLKVNGNSTIYFENNGSNYTVNRFEIGETKDINTYKKNGKVKLKTAKKGRDIILVNGKVRRIGW